MRFDGKVVVVTGAARGIGLACVQRFFSEGARVVLADVLDADGQRACAALDDGTGRAVYFHCNVAKIADCEALIDFAIERFSRIDIMVCNAGIVHEAGFLELREEDFDRVISVNLKGTFLSAQAAARRMAAQAPNTRGERGIIINLSSVNAVLASPLQTAYVASKGGVSMLTRTMAVSLAPIGIRVNAIGPGTIGTEMAQQAVLHKPDVKAQILGRTPIGRIGTPDDVAGVAAFLASDDASYFSGQTLYVDGGRLVLNYTMS